MKTVARRVQAPIKTGFVCESLYSGCAGEPFHGEVNGKRYCVFHFPDGKKNPEFNNSLERKLNKNDYDFEGFWFPQNVDFFRFEFTAAANFTSAIFNSHAGFDGAVFRAGAHFNGAIFRSGASFMQVTFSALANFHGAHFDDVANFFYASFVGVVNFTNVSFLSFARFEGATFADQVRFGSAIPHCGGITSLDLQFTRIQNPDRFHFHSLTVSPAWFLNVDARKFNFINVDWVWRAFQEPSKILRRRAFYRLIGCLP